MFSSAGIVSYINVFGLTLATAACSRAPAAPAPRPRAVRVAAVETRRERTLLFFGETEAKDRAVLAFTIPGRIESRPVGVGDRVRAGALLARLSTEELGLRLEQAEAGLLALDRELAQLQRDGARLERLAQGNAATKQQVEKIGSAIEIATARRRAAVAERREVERLLKEARLVAPFDGVVTELFRQSGEYAQPGQPVVAIAGDGALEIRVEVPESVRARLEVETPVEVRFPLAGSGERYAARIEAIGAGAAGTGRLFPVRLLLDPAARIVPGSTAEVRFQSREDPVTAVPIGAVAGAGAEPFVFVVKESVAKRRTVEAGEIFGAEIAVKGDLAEGDLVVVGGHANLADGDRVEVRR